MIKEYKTLPKYVSPISYEEKLKKTKFEYLKIRAQVGVFIDSHLGSVFNELFELFLELLPDELY